RSHRSHRSRAMGPRRALLLEARAAHPGAQLSLFDIQEGMRHQCFITNSHGDAADLELRHLGHARVEDRIRDAKSMGMCNLPFRDVVPNNAWFQLVLGTMDLVAWTKALLLGWRARDRRDQAVLMRVL